MRFLVCSICVVVAIVLATASSSGDEPVEPTPTGEPVIGTPVEPLPDSEAPRHEPFTPYDVGGLAAAWSYEQLTADEQLAADRGLDDDQTAIQSGYAAATAALAERASAERAAILLGVDEPLASTGVVP